VSAARRLAAAAIACVWLAGCGGDDEPDRQTTGGATAAPTATATLPGTATTTTTVPSPAANPEAQAATAVRECLAQYGYRATGGVRPPGTRGAPRYEILVAGPRGSAFIAFYGSLASAKRYEAKVRNNAGKVSGASVEREGTVTTVYVDLTDATARERIQHCVRQES
jgi:uncharacterized lipoprotein